MNDIVSSHAVQPRERSGPLHRGALLQVFGYVGGWHCGPESYYVTLRAFIVNVDGSRSNTVEYTIHCNGG